MNYSSLIRFLLPMIFMMSTTGVHAESKPEKWVVSWAASAQGPYPVGNPSAQPDLKLAFPLPERGARDQSFRMIVKPTLWGRETRVRFSNAFGTQPLSVDAAHIGLHQGSSAVVQGTNRPITFKGTSRTVIPAGESLWSDPVVLSFIWDPDNPGMASHKLAISFHITGESGPMTWHAKALQTSYLSFPEAGAVGQQEDESAFALSTASWYFIDALDMKVADSAFAIVCFGDSITDGTMSTLNGDDRWPDVLARRLRSLHGNRIAVVNAGIGGNQVVGPGEYSPSKPYAGGPSALTRIQRDVISLSGVGSIVWMEGINDFSKNGNASADEVIQGMRATVARVRAGLPGIRVIGATLTPALGTTITTHGSAEQDQKRRALNEFIRSSGVFDGVADFDRIVTDPATGAMKLAYVHNTTVGGEGDRLHPNRLGYLDMGRAIDLSLFAPAP
jgi:lysophospholipase L1-like esterase